MKIQNQLNVVFVVENSHKIDWKNMKVYVKERIKKLKLKSSIKILKKKTFQKKNLSGNKNIVIYKKL